MRHATIFGLKKLSDKFLGQHICIMYNVYNMVTPIGHVAELWCCRCLKNRGVPSTELLPLKRQPNEIFDLQFLSSFEPACATDQCVKIFSILFKFFQSYYNFSIEKYDYPQYCIILRGIIFFPMTFFKNAKCSPLLVE